MSATAPHMYAVVRTWNTRGTSVRYRFVAVPLIRELLDERYATGPMKYMMPLPDEPAPAPEPRRSGNFGARPRRNGRPLEPLDE